MVEVSHDPRVSSIRRLPLPALINLKDLLDKCQRSLDEFLEVRYLSPFFFVSLFFFPFANYLFLILFSRHRRKDPPIHVYIFEMMRISWNWCRVVERHWNRIYQNYTKALAR